MADGTKGDGRKYIVGWLTMKPGKRDEFLGFARPYVLECRKEEGCLFFEMTPSLDNPDVVVIAECFKDSAAHTLHLESGLFQEFWQRLDTVCLNGRFENVFADRVFPDSADFGPTGLPEVHPS
jgi:quinol monooxygenase YgiN